MGAKIAGPPTGGMYLWADFGRDTNELAAAGSREGVLLAPGSLFSPTQLPSTWMRVAAATCLVFVYAWGNLRVLARHVDLVGTARTSTPSATALLPGRQGLVFFVHHPR